MVFGTFIASETVTRLGHTKEVCDVTWHPKDIGVVVTSSDDCSVRIWRTDPFFNAEKCPYEPGDVIGRAVMSHRTIGLYCFKLHFEMAMQVWFTACKCVVVLQYRACKYVLLCRSEH